MKLWWAVLFLFLGTMGTAQESPLYQFHQAEGGLTVTLAGKTWGPYDKLEAQAYARDGSRTVLVVRGNGGLVLVTNEGPAGSFPPDYGLEALKVSSDGRTWAVAAGNGDVHSVWCAGRMWGPFPSLAALEVAQGGGWLLAAKTTEETAQVWVNGQEYPGWQDVPYAALKPDGSFWAFVGIKKDKTYFVTREKTWESLAFVNTDALVWDGRPWGFLVGDAQGRQNWSIEGRSFGPYQFSSPLMTLGRHWAFEAVKQNGQPVVVIDGKENPGRGLTSFRDSSGDNFTWLQSDGDKVFLRTLKP